MYSIWGWLRSYKAPIAVSILGVVRDLQKVCQANDGLFEDRAPFLAHKVNLLLRRHQLRGLGGTSRFGYKRYGCAPHRTQELAVQLQEYSPLGEQTEPYAYNAVAPGAPIDLVQLATTYHTGPGRLGYHDFDKAIRRFAALHSTSEEYVNLCPFMDAADLVRRMGTSKYLMSSFEAGYKGGQRWRRAVEFRRDVYADEREEIKKTSSPASHPFHQDPVDHRFCWQSRTPISTTSTSRSSSTSRRSMMILRLPIDARSAAETKSSQRSLLTRLRAL